MSDCPGWGGKPTEGGLDSFNWCGDPSLREAVCDLASWVHSFRSTLTVDVSDC